MAVGSNATPLDVALDELGRLCDRGVAPDSASIARLWHRVYLEAVRAGDVRLAILAADHVCRFGGINDVLLALTRAP